MKKLQIYHVYAETTSHDWIINEFQGLPAAISFFEDLIQSPDTIHAKVYRPTGLRPVIKKYRNPVVKKNNNNISKTIITA